MCLSSMRALDVVTGAPLFYGSAWGAISKVAVMDSIMAEVELSLFLKSSSTFGTLKAELTLCSYRAAPTPLSTGHSRTCLATNVVIQFDNRGYR